MFIKVNTCERETVYSTLLKHNSIMYKLRGVLNYGQGRNMLKNSDTKENTTVSCTILFYSV